MAKLASSPAGAQGLYAPFPFMAVASVYISSLAVTALTSQPERSWSKMVAPLNMLVISVAGVNFHKERALKLKL